MTSLTEDAYLHARREAPAKMHKITFKQAAMTMAMALAGTVQAQSGLAAAPIVDTQTLINSTTITDTAGNATTVTRPYYFFDNVQAAASAKNTFAQALDTQTSSFNQFDAATGVLVGVSGSLTSAAPANSYMQLSFGEAPKFGASGNLTAAWNVGGFTTSGSLISVLNNKDAFYGYSQPGAWKTLSLSIAPSSYDSFVGTGTIASTLQTNLSIQKSTVLKNNKTDFDTTTYSVAFTGSVPATINAATTSPALISPQASASLRYDYLRHSFASFLDNSSASTALSLDLSTANSSSLTILAGGDIGSATTGLDYTGFTCITPDQRACDAFSIHLASFSNLAAGLTATGSISLNPTAGTARTSATFLFNFADNAQTGNATTQLNSQIALTVTAGTVTAVPEPHGTAMLLAGLGAIGWMSRRRRQGADTRQVAKL